MLIPRGFFEGNRYCLEINPNDPECLRVYEVSKYGKNPDRSWDLGYYDSEYCCMGLLDFEREELSSFEGVDRIARRIMRKIENESENDTVHSPDVINFIRDEHIPLLVFNKKTSWDMGY